MRLVCRASEGIITQQIGRFGCCVVRVRHPRESVWRPTTLPELDSASGFSHSRVPSLASCPNRNQAVAGWFGSSGYSTRRVDQNVSILCIGHKIRTPSGRAICWLAAKIGGLVGPKLESSIPCIMGTNCLEGSADVQTTRLGIIGRLCKWTGRRLDEFGSIAVVVSAWRSKARARLQAISNHLARKGDLFVEQREGPCFMCKASS